MDIELTDWNTGGLILIDHQLPILAHWVDGRCGIGPYSCVAAGSGSGSDFTVRETPAEIKAKRDAARRAVETRDLFKSILHAGLARPVSAMWAQSASEIIQTATGFTYMALAQMDALFPTSAPRSEPQPAPDSSPAPEPPPDTAASS